jgi:WD40 repeat protein
VQHGNSVTIYSLEGRKQERTISGGASADGAIALSRDGTRLAQTRTDGTIAIWNTTDGALVTKLPYVPKPTGQRPSMTFAADGTLVVAIPGHGRNGRIQQWTLAPGDLVRLACATAGRDLTLTEWNRYAGTTAPADLRCRR